MIREISYEQLKIDLDYNNIFAMSLQHNKLFPGNLEIQAMIETILKVGRGQHLFISASGGTKIKNFLEEMLREKAQFSSDWCYVHNFKLPDEPRLLQLERGKGLEFKKSVESNITKTLEDCKKYSVSKELKELEKSFKEEILTQTEKELESLKSDAKKLGFSTHISEKGVFFIPIINGKKISESEYDNLPTEVQDVIVKDLDILEKTSKKVMKKLKSMKRDKKNRIRLLKQRIIDELIDINLTEIYEKHVSNESVRDYLDEIKADLAVELKRIFLEIDGEQVEKFKDLLSFEKIEKDYKHRYVVNFLKYNVTEGTPVTCANKATYYDLFGKIEYINEAGVFVTDFSCIQPGLFHRSNGGYLILDINDLICSKLIWDKFKKCLIDKKIAFENIREQLGALPIKTIQPKEMPLDLQVVLIGDEAIYEALHLMDSEFKIIFPFHLTIPESVDANEINLATYAAYLRNQNIDESAMKKLIEHCLKSTGNKKKLSTNLLKLDQLLSMCTFYAKENGQQFITAQEVSKGEEALNQYHQIHRKAIEELIIKGQIFVETTGKKVGQINALSVSSFTDYDIAYPIRITANSCCGEDGIISIDKENKMSGKVFGKGLSIITSYLNAIFAKDKSLSVNCTLCFEQMYGGIEGDSASCAEIYAILSNLSQIPIDQGIAITGSVDQFGNVQPIGCVSRKIDGFYQICKQKGLTGKQGVVVPYTNTEEILLSDEILRTIQENKFHIYSIDKIEDGLPILLGATFEKVKKAAMNLSIH